jgi:hypothetical protein
MFHVNMMSQRPGSANLELYYCSWQAFRNMSGIHWFVTSVGGPLSIGSPTKVGGNMLVSAVDPNSSLVLCSEVKVK